MPTAHPAPGPDTPCFPPVHIDVALSIQRHRQFTNVTGSLMNVRPDTVPCTVSHTVNICWRNEWMNVATFNLWLKYWQISKLVEPVLFTIKMLHLCNHIIDFSILIRWMSSTKHNSSVLSFSRSFVWRHLQTVLWICLACCLFQSSVS